VRLSLFALFCLCLSPIWASNFFGRRRREREGANLRQRCASWLHQCGIELARPSPLGQPDAHNETSALAHWLACPANAKSGRDARLAQHQGPLFGFRSAAARKPKPNNNNRANRPHNEDAARPLPTLTGGRASRLVGRMRPSKSRVWHFALAAQMCDSCAAGDRCALLAGGCHRRCRSRRRATGAEPARRGSKWPARRAAWSAAPVCRPAAHKGTPNSLGCNLGAAARRLVLARLHKSVGRPVESRWQSAVNRPLAHGRRSRAAVVRPRWRRRLSERPTKNRCEGRVTGEQHQQQRQGSRASWMGEVGGASGFHCCIGGKEDGGEGASGSRWRRMRDGNVVIIIITS